MAGLRIVQTRSGRLEAEHPVDVAVVDADGRLVASAGEPGLVTYWRSAAKPFQALPLVEDGVLAGLGWGAEELALACASHSSEPGHVALAERMLAGLSAPPSALACGPHVPLSAEVAATVLRERLTLSPVWSNCSGKHAAMLALARHHGWPLAGYERAEHPVQRRILAAVSRVTGLLPDGIGLGVDGCTAVCFALPLGAMARAYGWLASAAAPSAAAVRHAMVTYPNLVAGTGRLCTDLMRAAGGRVVAKIGADGIYGAALVAEGLGVALKVRSGSMPASGVALVEVLRQIAARMDHGLTGCLADPVLAGHTRPVISTTRGVPVGEWRAEGSLRFGAP